MKDYLEAIEKAFIYVDHYKIPAYIMSKYDKRHGGVEASSRFVVLDEGMAKWLLNHNPNNSIVRIVDVNHTIQEVYS